MATGTWKWMQWVAWIGRSVFLFGKSEHCGHFHRYISTPCVAHPRLHIFCPYRVGSFDRMYTVHSFIYFLKSQPTFVTGTQDQPSFRSCDQTYHTHQQKKGENSPCCVCGLQHYVRKVALRLSVLLKKRKRFHWARIVLNQVDKSYTTEYGEGDKRTDLLQLDLTGGTGGALMDAIVQP